MRHVSDVNWEPIDANVYDPYFLKKYIEEDNFKRVIHKDTPLVTGEKGSGKSALVKALHKKHSSDFTEIIEFNFDTDISTDTVVGHILKVCDISGFERLQLMADSWRYAILVTCMREVISNNKTNLTLEETKIYNYLKKHELIAKSLSDIIIDVGVKIWKKIERYTATEDRIAKDLYPGEIAAELLHEIRGLPIGDIEFKECQHIFSKYLKKKNKKILVSIDNFDLLPTEGPKRRSNIELIFYGLVEAVYKLTTGEEFHDVIHLKAVLPYDRWISVKMRDRDKYDPYCKKIAWDKVTLKAFLKKRITYSLELEQSISFKRAWNLIFPREIINTTVNIREDTFDYILRHTMWRPRHLQIHLTKLSQDFRERIITEEILRRSVSKSSKLIVRYWLEEHYINHPKLEEFIKFFKGKRNILRYSEVYTIVEKILERMSVDEYTTTEKIDAMYILGFFGTRNISTGKKSEDIYYPPVNTGNEDYFCRFQFNHANANITHGMEDDDEIVIHPLFNEFCDLRPAINKIIG